MAGINEISRDWLFKQEMLPLCTSVSLSVSGGFSYAYPGERYVRYRFFGTGISLIVCRTQVVLEDEYENVIAATNNCGDCVEIGDGLLSSMPDYGDSHANGMCESIIYKIITGDIAIQ